MQYTKPPLSFEQQAELLISRGLTAKKQDADKNNGFPQITQMNADNSGTNRI